MHKPSITGLVYKTLYPRPRSTDPSSLSAHITRNIVPEVRIETQTFYGLLDCIEAQYPGLDYTHLPHRRRLSRFPHHKRLFKVFDELRLTDSEILALCVWEGTRSAKEKYERDAGKPIRDTTVDGVAPAEPVTTRPRAYFPDDYDWQPSTGRTTRLDETHPDIEDQMSDEDEIDTHTSVGVQLNQELRRAAEARARGEPATLNGDFEEWMKETLERSELSPDAVMQSIQQRRPLLVNGSQNQGQSLSATPLTGSTSSVGPTVAQTATRAASSNPHIVDQFHSTLHNLQAMSAQMTADSAALSASITTRSPTEAAR